MPSPLCLRRCALSANQAVRHYPPSPRCLPEKRIQYFKPTIITKVRTSGNGSHPFAELQRYRITWKTLRLAIRLWQYPEDNTSSNDSRTKRRRFWCEYPLFLVFEAFTIRYFMGKFIYYPNLFLNVIPPHPYSRWISQKPYSAMRPPLHRSTPPEVV
jgi:hypothetical protein